MLVMSETNVPTIICFTLFLIVNLCFLSNSTDQVFDDLKAALDNIKILGDGDYSEDRLKDAIEPIRYRFPSNVTDQQILADLKTLLAQIEANELMEKEEKLKPKKKFFSCLNDGQKYTIDQATGNFICVCKPGYSGEICEIDLSHQTTTEAYNYDSLDCSLDPCLNSGQCIETIVSITEGLIDKSITIGSCRCPPGLTGKICETKLVTCDDLQMDPCPEDHICITTDAGYECQRFSRKKG
ncbi:uncharacterized protein LOC107372133 [Tetranychus urticae]|uniref:uncharacterized protein LOC107372133 n=1 Tax=Tetranychus urticae TaxID=32264 RepID=UPI000D6594C2|nr:uncharacterized protein LOC107372133 [Tetranychus urticae]